MNLSKNVFEIYKKIIFLLPPETAHVISLNLAEIVFKLWRKNQRKENEVMRSKKFMGIEFPNQLGLAAGFDKNGDYINFISNIGLGFIEIGTVTPKPQYGNPKPRIFRLIQDEAIINSLGFNNKGVKYLKKKLSKVERNQPIGINIGKNSTTPIIDAHNDYKYCMDEIYHLADYITLNISSPNTKDLRQLQAESYFDNFLYNIKNHHQKLVSKFKKNIPLIVKISPDIEDNDLQSLCKLLIRYEVEGIIATNTTISKPKNLISKAKLQSGGLSGKPLLEKSNNLIKKVKNLVGDNITIIGAGGVTSSISANTKLESGADLLQLYTGLVFHGTDLIKEITRSFR